MKKFFTLVKMLFTLQFRANSATDKKKRVGTIIVFVLLGICFLPMLGGVAFLTYNLGSLFGANCGVLAFLILGCQALVLLLGLSSLIAGVFMPKDADKLLYLPVKSSTIFTAKLTVAYLNEVLTTAVTILFALLPYGIGAGFGAGYYLMLFPALLLIPLLPILIGTIVSMPIVLLLNKVGKNGVGKTILTTIFFLLFMAVYMSVMFAITGLENASPNGEITTEQLLQLLQGVFSRIGEKMVYVHTNYVLSDSMIANSFVNWICNFGLTVIEFGVLGTLTFLVAKPFYKYMLASQVEGGGSAKNNAKVEYQSKPTSVIKQLIVTDFKRTIRDSQMGFQCFAGVIMMPLIVVVLGMSMSMGGEGESPLDFTSPIYQLICPIALVAYLTMIGAGTNILGLYPISRENNSFYILKSLPIDFNKILTAKVILSTILMVIVYLLTAIVSMIVLKIQWYFALAMLIVLTLLGFGTQCITTRVDLKEPKFGWSNFNQSLKNAKNSWVAMLVGIIVMIVIGGVSVLFILWYVATLNNLLIILMWLALIVISGVFALVSYKVMVKNSQQLFERIQA